MRSYTHFTLTERESLRILLEKGCSYREIARQLNRSPSSISREIKRNGKKDGTVQAWWGVSQYIHRRKKCRRKLRLVADVELRAYVEEKLAHFWSPEIIVARWKMEHPDAKLSASTIYRALKTKQLSGFSERTHLRQHGKRKYVSSGTTGINPVKPEHLIDERPAEINLRSRLGDWEGDTIRGKTGQGCMFTAIDRRSRLIRLGLIPGKHTKEATAAAVIEALKDQKVLSLTLDNGMEFANHRNIAHQLNTTVYFAHPCSPWERGSNENANALIRFFFPKGCDFRSVTQDYLEYAEMLLNTRPRKCLGWLSPVEFLSKCCT